MERGLHHHGDGSSDLPVSSPITLVTNASRLLGTGTLSDIQ
jgi:hypothetical protein